MASIDSQQYGDKQRLLIIVLMIIGVSGLHLLFPTILKKAISWQENCISCRSSSVHSGLVFVEQL